MNNPWTLRKFGADFFNWSRFSLPSLDTPLRHVDIHGLTAIKRAGQNLDYYRLNYLCIAVASIFADGFCTDNAKTWLSWSLILMCCHSVFREPTRKGKILRRANDVMSKFK